MNEKDWDYHFLCGLAQHIVIFKYLFELLKNAVQIDIS